MTFPVRHRYAVYAPGEVSAPGTQPAILSRLVSEKLNISVAGLLHLRLWTSVLNSWWLGREKAIQVVSVYSKTYFLTSARFQFMALKSGFILGCWQKTL